MIKIWGHLNWIIRETKIEIEREREKERERMRLNEGR